MTCFQFFSLDAGGGGEEAEGDGETATLLQSMVEGPHSAAVTGLVPVPVTRLRAGRAGGSSAFSVVGCEPEEVAFVSVSLDGEIKLWHAHSQSESAVDPEGTGGGGKGRGGRFGKGRGGKGGASGEGGGKAKGGDDDPVPIVWSASSVSSFRGLPCTAAAASLDGSVVAVAHSHRRRPQVYEGLPVFTGVVSLWGAGGSVLLGAFPLPAVFPEKWNLGFSPETSAEESGRREGNRRLGHVYAPPQMRLSLIDSSVGPLLLCAWGETGGGTSVGLWELSGFALLWKKSVQGEPRDLICEPAPAPCPFFALLLAPPLPKEAKGKNQNAQREKAGQPRKQRDDDATLIHAFHLSIETSVPIPLPGQQKGNRGPGIRVRSVPVWRNSAQNKSSVLSPAETVPLAGAFLPPRLEETASGREVPVARMAVLYGAFELSLHQWYSEAAVTGKDPEGAGPPGGEGFRAEGVGLALSGEVEGEGGGAEMSPVAGLRPLSSFKKIMGGAPAAASLATASEAELARVPNITARPFALTTRPADRLAQDRAAADLVSSLQGVPSHMAPDAPELLRSVLVATMNAHPSPVSSVPDAQGRAGVFGSVPSAAAASSSATGRESRGPRPTAPGHVPKAPAGFTFDASRVGTSALFLAPAHARSLAAVVGRGASLKPKQK
uniref:Uncharacterized protein n=1 Tax=Chromera velia CCMP2878 TaxID=1169474 RepID=A0A0G4HMQ1_9ALVE|eukprot:Cvel_29363.t1-p1 / transcript=Cvel_29363.t1 / gene=Cvel_29363 / organism=Chromera_velia_CCMP2878 / gene_product=hypothetical protein / transcript_product=hypothetical protein / location=Cvel_scaffold4001:108-3532(+) / protein_length=662 / sequence_SO=supercontig / SO=protein_coding / is_pseudo=false